MSPSRSALLPQVVYLDAGAFVRELSKSHPDNAAMVSFFQDGATSNTRLLTSAVIFPELNNAFLRIELQKAGKTPAEIGALLRDPHLIDTAIWVEVQRVCGLLDALIGTAGVMCCKVDPNVRKAAYALQVQHRLRSFDAFHVATAQTRKISDVVTFDSDFDVIPGLTIWTSPGRAKALAAKDAAVALAQPPGSVAVASNP